MARHESARPVSLAPAHLDRQPTNLERALARQLWAASPHIGIRYEPDADRLTVRVLDSATAAKMDTHEPLFIGFDGLDEDAWPTLMTQMAARRNLLTAQLTPGSRTLLQFIGGTAAHAVQRAVAGGQPANVTVTIDAIEADALINYWRTAISDPGTDEIAQEAEQLVAEITTVLIHRSTLVHRDLPAAPLASGPRTQTRETVLRELPLDDEATFEYLMGRRRRGPIEPWPLAFISLTRNDPDYWLTVSIELPHGPKRPLGAVTATVRVDQTNWSIPLAPEPTHDTQHTRTLIGCRLLPADHLPGLRDTTNQGVLEITLTAQPSRSKR
ncbi:hypothetical protein [Intrasporangium sp.]|uniref:hypothetical protein n=1 Tax=Intrasporangium sp. TaxID=1925024 RepID=UPI00322175E4